MTDTVVIAESNEEDAGYRFSWGLAIAGGVAATAVTFFLLTLGSGFGLLLASPSARFGASSPTFLTGGAIYFFAAQAVGFAVGGHIVGRLLGPLPESPVQEEFRVAAHGFVAWAVTVLASCALVVFVATAPHETSIAPLYGQTTAGSNEASDVAYRVDVLLHSGTGSDLARGSAARAEAAHILDRGFMFGEPLTASDRSRLVDIVAADAGVSRDEAATRIDNAQLDARSAADRARRIASYVSLWIAASLLFGAIIAMFSAVLAWEEELRQAA